MIPQLVARLIRSCWFDSSRGTTNASRLSSEGERSSPPPLSTQTLVEELTPSLFNVFSLEFQVYFAEELFYCICYLLSSRWTHGRWRSVFRSSSPYAKRSIHLMRWVNFYNSYFLLILHWDPLLRWRLLRWTWKPTETDFEIFRFVKFSDFKLCPIIFYLIYTLSFTSFLISN